MSLQYYLLFRCFCRCFKSFYIFFQSWYHPLFSPSITFDIIPDSFNLVISSWFSFDNLFGLFPESIFAYNFILNSEVSYLCFSSCLLKSSFDVSSVLVSSFKYDIVLFFSPALASKTFDDLATIIDVRVRVRVRVTLTLIFF